MEDTVFTAELSTVTSLGDVDVTKPAQLARQPVLLVAYVPRLPAAIITPLFPYPVAGMPFPALAAWAADADAASAERNLLCRKETSLAHLLSLTETPSTSAMYLRTSRTHSL